MIGFLPQEPPNPQAGPLENRTIAARSRRGGICTEKFDTDSQQTSSYFSWRFVKVIDRFYRENIAF